MHNTFDITNSDGKWVAVSHNFPEFSGQGATEEEAIKELNRAIIYYVDNSPKAYLDRVRARVKKKLLCECGVKLEEPALVIYKG